MVTVLWNLDEERGAAVKQENQHLLSTKDLPSALHIITSSNPHNNPGKLKV